ncbi:MAG TPA: RDD family protein [Adhaeribacter sp.]|nr:RDD family protein [Adhaeribacter sp.]
MSGSRSHKHSIIRRSSAFASLECRFGAFLIDTCLFIFFQTFATYFLVGYPFELYPEARFPFSELQVFSSHLDYVGKLLYSNIYFILIHWLYYSIMEASEYQGTVGKIVLGIRVTDIDGNRIGFLQATVRYFGKFLSVGILFGGFLVAFFNYRHQTLHDLIAQCAIRVKDPQFYFHHGKEHSNSVNV